MHGMRPSDIGLLSTVGEVTIAPDGQRAVYVLTTVDLEANEYRSRLWLAGLGGDAAPVPVAGARRARLPRWSPDGRLLAWVDADGDDDAAVLMVLPVDGPGQASVVCRWPDTVSELVWAPTSDRLAFVGRVRDERRYGKPGQPKRPKDMPPRRVTRLRSRLNGEGWVVDRPTQVHVARIDGAAPVLTLTEVEGGAEAVAWSPDGRRLAYVAATHDTWDLDGRNDLWSVGADGSEPTRLTDTSKAWDAPSWSPDGSRLAALVHPTPMEEPRHAQLHVLDLEGNEPTRWAAALDRNLAPHGATRPPIWLAGGELLVGAEDGGRTHLYVVSPPGDGDGLRRIVDGEVVVGSYDAAGGTVAYSASGPAAPSELWSAPLDAGSAPTRRSHHGAALAGAVALVAPERFTAVSADGTEVECWAMPPAEQTPGARYPAVLNIHGGPFTQYGVGFFDEFQFQVGAGLGVLYCNPRGSSGYSEAWGRAIRWPEAEVDPGSGWGGVDVDDVIACVEEATKRFAWIDPDRVGVQGGSYGGYLTSWIVGHSDRFAAAVSERAVNNLLTMEHNSDIAGFFRSDVGWSHLERPDLYARQSPVSYVEAMTTPLLIIHSEDDLRCPITQAEELFVALRLLGRKPELVRFPAESHELSRSGSPTHRVMRAEIILEWFARHLGAGES